MSDSSWTRIVLGSDAEEMAKTLAALQKAGVVLYEVKFTGGDWVALTWKGFP